VHRRKERIINKKNEGVKMKSPPYLHNKHCTCCKQFVKELARNKGGGRVKSRNGQKQGKQEKAEVAERHFYKRKKAEEANVANRQHGGRPEAHTGPL
jgi:hypothetical protein